MLFRSDLPSLRITLVEQALAMVERGEEDVSLRAVARAAGVSAMAPYRHFADKTALLGAVALRGFIMMAERAAAADDHPDPAQALIRQGQSYIAFAREKPSLFRLMFMDPAGKSLPPSDSADGYRRLAARVASLAHPDELESATLACWGVVHGLATLALDGRIMPDLAREAEALALLPRAISAHRVNT